MAKPGAAKYAVHLSAFTGAHAARRSSLETRIDDATSRAVRLALDEEGETADEARQAGQKAYHSTLADARRDEGAAHVRLMRCVFGNPFRAAACAPDWKTDTVLLLANQMYDSRDFSAMPILADALQEAGCTSDTALDHCRSGAPHVRGCWVVDLVLGKERPRP